MAGTGELLWFIGIEGCGKSRRPNLQFILLDRFICQPELQRNSNTSSIESKHPEALGNTPAIPQRLRVSMFPPFMAILPEADFHFLLPELFLVYTIYPQQGIPLVIRAATDGEKRWGVKQVSAAHGSTTIISTTNTPGNNETLYVPKGASSLTITATPEPGSSWPNGYPTWTLNGTSVGTAGNTTYSLSRATVGTYTVSAMCGTSKKAINVVVFGVDIYAETSAGVVNDGSMTSLTECMENRQIIYSKSYIKLPVELLNIYSFSNR